jgi:hypothetical protein
MSAALPPSDKPIAEKAPKAEARAAAEPVDVRLGRLEARLDRIEAALTRLASAAPGAEHPALDRLEARLDRLEQSLDRVADAVTKVADTVSDVAEGVSRLRKRFNLSAPARRPAEVASDCVRVLVEAFIDDGPDGRPLRLGRGDVRSGPLATWLLKRHAEKVERFPKAPAAPAAAAS